jgi:hypothetical protein
MISRNHEKGGLKLMDKRRSLSVLGVAIVCGGVFTPVLTAPVFGNISYLLCGKGDGTLLIALSLLSLFFSLKSRYSALWYTGIVCLSIVTFTFYDIHRQLSQLNAGTTQLYHLSWGWGVLAAGIGTIMASALLEGKKPRVADSPGVPGM